MYSGAQAETSRTSNDRLKLPQVVTYVKVVTYVTRLPFPSSPSYTSLSYVNQSSTITHDRRSSGMSSAVSPWSPSTRPVVDHRGADEAAAGEAPQNGDGDAPGAASGGVQAEDGPAARPPQQQQQQQRRPSAVIRSTLSCSQLLGELNNRRRPSLVTAKSNPALIRRTGAAAGDDQQRDGPAPVSSA